MSGNLILTTVYGLNVNQVRPFFSSLSAVGFSGKTIVFASNISEECRAMMADHHAEIIDFESLGLQLVYASLAKRLLSLPKAVFRGYWQHPKDERCLLVNCWRFFAYHKYLLALTEKPEFILLADSRDVVFQANPFVFTPGLSVASECVHGKISQSRGNSKWLWEAAGFSQLKKLGDLTPVCAGTTAADYDSMIKYLGLMTSSLKDRFFWGLFDSVDQGLHNYFVHNQMIKPLQIHTNWHGPFLTLDSETVRLGNKNADGWLCNQNGSVVPIVHQYDRIKGLYQKNETVPPVWQFLVH